MCEYQVDYQAQALKLSFSPHDEIELKINKILDPLISPQQQQSALNNACIIGTGSTQSESV